MRHKLQDLTEIRFTLRPPRFRCLWREPYKAMALEEFREQAKAAIGQFDLAVILHATWKPCAFDGGLHARLGESYATRTFRAVHTALRREMFMTLMRLWDTGEGIGLMRLAEALKNKTLLDAVIGPAPQNDGSLDGATSAYMHTLRENDFRSSAKEFVRETQDIAKADQPVVVALDVEHHATALQHARRRELRYDITRPLPLSRNHRLDPCAKRLLGLRVLLPERPQMADGDNAHR